MKTSKNGRLAQFVPQYTLSECDRSGDARIFVEFMLKALRDALAEVKRGVGKGVVKSVVKILDLLRQ